MHPVAAFGSKVSILPEIRNDAGDGVAFVGLKSHAPMEANVPDVSRTAGRCCHFELAVLGSSWVALL